MPNDQIKCPLCQGSSYVFRSELIAKLRDPELLARVEVFVAQLEAAASGKRFVSTPASDFQAQVHSWNPANPMWKRSPKE